MSERTKADDGGAREMEPEIKLRGSELIPLTFHPHDGVELFRITPEGTFVFADGVEVEEAAREFARWFNEEMGHLLTTTPRNPREEPLWKDEQGVLDDPTESEKRPHPVDWAEFMAQAHTLPEDPLVGEPRKKATDEG